MTSSETSPVQSLADRDGLGQLLHSYRGRFRQSVVAVAAIAAFAALVALCSFAGGSTEIALILSLIGAPLVVMTSWFVVWEWRHSSDDLHVFHSGLIHVDRSRTIRSFPWSAITEILVRRMELDVQDIPVRTVHFVKLVRSDGATLILNNRFRGIEALSELVQDEVVQAQLPGALERLRGGETITFDSVVVDATGIRHGGQTLPWSSIVTIGVNENVTSTKITIRSKQRRRSYTRRLFPSRPFPNLGLLGAITRTLGAAG